MGDRKTGKHDRTNDQSKIHYPVHTDSDRQDRHSIQDLMNNPRTHQLFYDLANQIVKAEMLAGDAAELRAWVISEGIAMGAVSGTTYDLHADLVATHEGGSVMSLWKAIEAQHTNNDSSLRHQAWSLLFGHRMTLNDDPLEYWRRGADVKARIDRITPRALSALRR